MRPREITKSGQLKLMPIKSRRKNAPKFELDLEERKVFVLRCMSPRILCRMKWLLTGQ